ncbi:MAG: S8 family serine peptidase [Pseudobdellovibrionaceae bacterium]|nr:MAG: S8 family serine peptidase [Pseudobdellovibrionaceae bacterium]
MQRRSVLFVLLITGLFSFGCGKAFEPTGDSTLASMCTVNPQALKKGAISFSSPFNHNKVQISESDSAQIMSLDKKLKAHTEYVALIDNECVNDSPGEHSEEIVLASRKRTHRLRVQAYRFQLNRDYDLDELESELRKDPCLIGVSPQARAEKFAISDDPFVDRQEHLINQKADKAWEIFYDDSTGIKEDVVIAVIDTGVDYTHPDLKSVMWTDSNGKFGYDFAENDDDPMDGDTHGTHVAGLAAAATNNQVGGAGVMASHAKVMAVKVFPDTGSGAAIDDIVNGIRYAADQGADIANMSLGAAARSTALQDAVIYAAEQGTFLVAAAGNDNKNLNSSFYSPAGYAKDVDGFMAVASTDAGTRNRSSFSNYSSTYVEIAAPGSYNNSMASSSNSACSSGISASDLLSIGFCSKLLSTLPGNQYGYYQGTSMASPVAAGAAGLALAYLRSQGGHLTPADLERVMKNGSVTESSLSGYVQESRHLDLLTLAEYSRDFASQRPVITRQPSSQAVELGDSIELSVEVSGDSDVDLQWLKNGEEIDGATGLELPIDYIANSDLGLYQVRVSRFGMSTLSNVAQVAFVLTCP